ncbi:MAG: TonB family protein [Candidatus Coatesbacteria bacterium]|nr:TonB family protein [Candidatus Coatesbacteria bacterium]
MKKPQLKQPLLLSLLLNLLVLQFLYSGSVEELEPITDYDGLVRLSSLEVLDESSTASEAGLTLAPTRPGEEVRAEKEQEDFIEEVEERREASAEVENLPEAEQTVVNPGLGSRSNIVVSPYCLTPRDPRIPETLQNSGWEGRVRLAVKLDREGRVTAIEILESSGREDADRDAVRLYRNTRWSPCYVDGEPVTCTAQLWVEYEQQF